MEDDKIEEETKRAMDDVNDAIQALSDHLGVRVKTSLCLEAEDVDDGTDYFVEDGVKWVEVSKIFGNQE